MEKISVIVPVYKVEKYLHRCIDSIIEQTYKNLEIILIDDGSPDNCPAICDEYPKKDKRIRVIHRENKGVSSARNIGINEATGDYIAFVDSDDWIEKNMYEILMLKMKENKADVIRGRYLINNSEISEETLSNNIYNKDEIKDEFIYHLVFGVNGNGENVVINPSICTYLIKTEIIKKNEIVFDEAMKIGEDYKFIINVLDKANKLITIDNNIYHYCLREDSAMNSYKPTLLKDLHLRYECIENIFSSDKYVDLLREHKKIAYIGAILNCCYKLSFSNYASRVNALKEIRDVFIGKKIFYVKNTERITRKSRCMCQLLKYNMLNSILIIGGGYNYIHTLINKFSSLSIKKEEI